MYQKTCLWVLWPVKIWVCKSVQHDWSHQYYIYKRLGSLKASCIQQSLLSSCMNTMADLSIHWPLLWNMLLQDMLIHIKVSRLTIFWTAGIRVSAWFRFMITVPWPLTVLNITLVDWSKHMIKTLKKNNMINEILSINFPSDHTSRSAILSRPCNATIFSSSFFLSNNYNWYNYLNIRNLFVDLWLKNIPYLINFLGFQWANLR